MGYNTSILILNDARDLIRSNPLQFTEKVLILMDTSGGIEPGQSVSLGNHSNPISLITRSHADILNLVLIGQNCSKSLLQTGIGEEQKDVDILSRAAFKLGYALVKNT